MPLQLPNFVHLFQNLLNVCAYRRKVALLSATSSSKVLKFVVVVVVVIAPSHPRNGGTAQTAIHVYAFNLIEIRLGEKWQPISNQS